MSSSDGARARYARLQGLFLEARALAALERAALLAEVRAEDAALASELELLLAHDRPATDQPAAPNSPLRRELDALHEQSAREVERELPERLGEYRLVRKLGEGGMGAVYEARQEKLQRTVALKVLRTGSFSPQALRRFEHEGAFLGRLAHPGIARIYDSGRAETPHGSQPYFAMELVVGVPLTEYARAQMLALNERIELLARVADAVQHAHRQGVIHRDLKPDNILVDADGQPKILDFGIARASDSDVRLTLQHTDVGQILGTLAYMSPEQAAGNPRGIDERSDVYSLGVLLFELIAERLPYDVAHKPLPEALRIIQEVEPTRLGTVDSNARGDVETIVLTALEKDRSRRYPSAGAFAADLRHFLREEPIDARPASRIYRLNKFVRRNRTVVVATLLVLVALAGGLVASLRFALAEAARRREVLQLSASQDVEELVARADALWPLHKDRIPEYRQWIDDAEQLVRRLPALRATLDRLRARALPRTSAEAARDRRAHPRYPELQSLEAAITWRRRLLKWRVDGVPVQLPELGELEGLDVERMHGLAYEYVQPERQQCGGEALGLALALRAHERAPLEQKADTANTLALAYLAVGDDVRAEATYELVPQFIEQAVPERRSVLVSVPGRYDWPARIRHLISRYREQGWQDRVEGALRGLESQRATLVEQIEAQREWRYPASGAEDHWWDRELERLIAALEALERDLLDERGITAAHGWSVRRRLEFAEALLAGEAPDGAYASAWDAALEEIQAAYPGVDIQPLTGLVPIGPVKGTEPELWEFAHLASGDPAVRNKDGSLVVTERTGVVLILLPGGEFWMGAQSADPGAQNYDEGANDENEFPARKVFLSPFFISKYELTQGQWRRLTGENPSRITPGPSATKPVDMVTWDASTEVCRRYGLTLPTSAEWEFAARGGTSTPWWTGKDARSLAGMENLADEFARTHGGTQSWAAFEPWDDGCSFSAPVDRFQPNPFGLYNVLGNLREWSCDRVTVLERFSPLQRDPVAIPATGATRQLLLKRGGSFEGLARLARSAQQGTGTYGDYYTGVRPALPLEGR
ncbi:MAG: bifunctional serine/threonine-protein kinase/formylglycine-generating enzyme family protein [Planctomycetota bacterium]